MSHVETFLIPLEPFKKEFDCHEHREILFSKIERLWRKGRSCDFIIEAGGIEFHCHRIFLVSISKFFSCLDKYNTVSSETKKITVTLPFTDAVTINTILEYVYTGQLIVKCNNFIHLIYAADYFLFDAMLESISKTLKLYLSSQNVIEYYELANHINNKSLYSVTMKFILRNAYKLHKENKLTQMSVKDILSIIQDKRLIIREDSVMYFGNTFKKCLKEIIIAWITFDFKTRKEHEFVLLSCFENQFLGNWYNKVKFDTYRYIEPIPRAYFLNSAPFGQHPPSLVCPPFNFRCLGRNIRRTFIDNSPHKWFIKKIIIYIIPDWNNVAAIADIQVDYKHYWSEEVQSFKALLDNYTGYLKEEINLEDTERILQLDIYHGWMIYGIKFYSNKNKVFGLYGSSSGELTKINFQRDYSNSMYLHGFAFISVYTKDWHAINWLTVYGSMINKDSYYQDFQVAFEADFENYCKIEESLENSGTNDKQSMIQIEPESYLQDITYSLPQTIEDLFYQWRRYMRIMRLSVIRRNNSIMYLRERGPLLPLTISELSSLNFSSTQLTDEENIRHI